MCGIAGIISLSANQLRGTGAVEKMAKQMIHRGPDDEGYLVAWKQKNKLPLIFSGSDTSPLGNHSIPYYPKDNISGADDIHAHLFFAHRRLAIQDLSPYGHQPMSSHNGRYWIIYNGEIYNFKDIASELKKARIILHGHSDTEVLINAYATWGEKCLDKFNGMFAFAIWDDKEKTLFCARDRIGIKPFYYTIQNNQFIFASDIKTIIASRLYTPTADLEGLYHAMSFGIAPRPLTAFKDVFALEQSHWLKIDQEGHITKQRYWKLPVGTQDMTMTEPEAVELLENHLQASVTRRLVADVQVGTFMSGGIDSTTISAIASEQHPGIKAFTLAFEQYASELDELSQAQATAAMHPMEHIVEKVKPEVVLRDLHEMILGYEEPFYNLAANYVISRMVAKNGIKVILNGLGGDELFAGYGHYRWISRWHLLRKLSPLIKLTTPFLGQRGQKLDTLMRANSADCLHTALFSQTTEKNKQSLFTDSSVQDFNSIEYLHKLYVGEDIAFSDDLEAFSYMDIMNYIGNHHVHRVDQFTMRFSIEGRFPFLDHELIEAAFRIPSKYKIKGKLQKYVLRQVAQKYIHPSCLSMKKKGFGLPLKQWMQGSLKSVVENKWEKLKERNIFIPEELNKRYEQYQLGKRNFTEIWQLVAVEMWFESFMDAYQST